MKIRNKICVSALFLLMPIIAIGDTLTQRVMLTVTNRTPYSLYFSDFYHPAIPKSDVISVTTDAATIRPHQSAHVLIITQNINGIAGSINYVDQHKNPLTLSFNDPPRIYDGGSTNINSDGKKISGQVVTIKNENGNPSKTLFWKKIIYHLQK